MPYICYMAITFVGATNNPLDNGTLDASSVALAPAGLGATTGDLVIWYGTQRGAGSITVGNTGGQTWNALGANTSVANISLQTFWATFNGAWTGANPSLSFGTATCTSVVMVIFRPTGPTYSWTLDTGVAAGLTTVAGATVATTTISGATPSVAPNVTLASWHTADDNTWGTLTGTNWSKTGLLAQYRNLGGNDSSTTIAYQIQAATAFTNNVSQTQLTQGNDRVLWRRFTFYEQAASDYIFLDPMGRMGFFGI